MDPVEVLRAHFPALDVRDARTIEDGWDSLVVDVNQTYIFRFPRRPEVAERMERELRLLPELAEVLPVSVPRFEFVARNGLLCVGHAKVVGTSAGSDLDEVAGEELGRFLSALHAFPVERGRVLGVEYFEPDAWRERFQRFCWDLRRRVLPLLSRAECEPVLVHADLGPEHVLCRDGRVVGVIDWSDARIGDGALDLAWCLNGTPPTAAAAAASVYGIDDATRERSLFYHRLGPWYEALHGLDTGQERFVDSGIEGIRVRLPG